MGGVGVRAALPPFVVKEKLPFRPGTVDVEINANSAQIAALLTSDAEFPIGQDISVAEASVKAGVGKNIAFDIPGKGTVALAASAGALARLGVYFDRQKLLADANAKEFADAIAPLGQREFYATLLGRYDASASAKGAVALGAPTVKFSSEHSSSASLGTIRRFAAHTLARDAVLEALDSIALPNCINGLEDLKPGAILLASADGTLNVSLCGSYGYNLNWVREAQFAGLAGDIGLKIQLGIETNIGLKLSGSYRVLVSRSFTDPVVVRVRVHKDASREFNFALDAGAVVTASQTVLPENLDDFVASLFGLGHRQWLADLREIQNWVSGSATLPASLADIGTKYLSDLLERTVWQALYPPDAQGNPKIPFGFDAAKDELIKFLDTWAGIDSRVSGTIWKLMRDEKVNRNKLDQIGQIASEVSNASDANAYVAILNKYCSLPKFLSSDAGQVLEAIAFGSVLRPLQEQQLLEKMKQVAAATATVLDATSSQGKLLAALHQFIDPKTKLDKIKSELDQFGDSWVRAHMAALLGKSLDSTGVEKLRKFINAIESRAVDIWRRAVKALNDTYTFSLTETFQKATKDDALLDVEFDFGAVGIDIAQLEQALHQVLGGDYNEFLLKNVIGVKLNRAVLTHGITRHNHLELHVPFYDVDFDHINRSLASANIVQNDAGRLVFYDVDATDDVSVVTKKGASSDSQLTIGANMSVQAGNATRVFDEQGFVCRYAFREYLPSMSRSYLEFQIRPLVELYLPKAFSSAHGPYSTWVSELERTAGHAPVDRFGPTLISLELSYPGAILANWLKAPASDKAQAYMTMSRTIQAGGLRKLLPYYYFSDLRHYKDVVKGSPAFVLLTYAALMPSTSVQYDRGEITPNVDREPTWDVVDPELRKAMVLRPETISSLTMLMDSAARFLEANGLKDEASYYKPTGGNLRSVISTALNSPLFPSLLLVEDEIIRGAVKAGKFLAAFQQAAGRDIKAAVRAFADWGAKVSDAFNDDLCSVYGDRAVHMMAGALMAIAASALGGRQAIAPSALLRVILLKPDTALNDAEIKEFLRGDHPDPERILIQQTIVNA